MLWASMESHGESKLDWWGMLLWMVGYFVCRSNFFPFLASSRSCDTFTKHFNSFHCDMLVPDEVVARWRRISVWEFSKCRKSRWSAVMSSIYKRSGPSGERGFEFYIKIFLNSSLNCVLHVNIKHFWLLFCGLCDDNDEIKLLNSIYKSTVVY